MTEIKASIQQQALLWLEKGFSNEQVKAELLNMGIEERNIPEMLREFKKMRNARNTSIGLYYILAGALLCFISCVWTLTVSATSGFVLYGLTSMGIIVVFIGLARIFN